MNRYKMTRAISKSLAPLVEQLELEQPRVITRAELARMARARELSPWTLAMANRLKAEGWLLSLKTKGVWEFAPGARAGAISFGDPYIELRATLKRRPGFPAQLAYDSAAWLLGFMQRPPEREVISIPDRIHIPAALAGFRVVHQRPALPLAEQDGLPRWQLESLIVLMAARPDLFRDWPNVSQWLKSAALRADESRIGAELALRPMPVRIRTAYMLEQGNNIRLARELMAVAKTNSLTYFGPRRRGGRYDVRYNLYDAVLRS